MPRTGLFAASLLALSIALPAATAREIDNHGGILFFCKPLRSEAWTLRVCEEAATEMTSWASRTKKPIVLLKMTDTRETNNEKARAAGFDPKHGLWVLLTIEPRTHPAGWDLNARADGISTKQPVPGVPQTTTYTKSEILARGVPVDEAADRGKRILGSIMTVLTLVMRPL